jgi:anti-sigma factor RsiW
MEERIHELTAGYALDALDPVERGAYEIHLAGCGRCQEELAAFWEVTGSLAYAGAGATPAPPPELRERLLARARAERPNVVPLRPRRWATPLAATVAAAAAVVAVGLGLWASSLQQDLDDARELSSVLADPQARAIALEGADGRLVVTETGEAVLVMAGLPSAPAGKAYEMWVIQDGRPDPAGLFDDESVVQVGRTVPPGGTVAVTLEDDEGAVQPTGQPLFTAQA